MNCVPMSDGKIDVPAEGGVFGNLVSKTARSERRIAREIASLSASDGDLQKTRSNVMGKTLRKIIPPSSQPHLHVHGREIQEFGTVRLLPLGLSHDTRAYSCQRLNQLLADTQILYALY